MVLDEPVEFSPRALSAVPSVAPKMVWAISVSAAQIEVNWEALPAAPERVLGYEVQYDSLHRPHSTHIDSDIMYVLAVAHQLFSLNFKCCYKNSIDHSTILPYFDMNYYAPIAAYL